MSDVEYVALNTQSAGRRAYTNKAVGGGIDLWTEDLLKPDCDETNNTAEDGDYET